MQETGKRESAMNRTEYRISTERSTMTRYYKNMIKDDMTTVLQGGVDLYS